MTQVQTPYAAPPAPPPAGQRVGRGVVTSSSPGAYMLARLVWLAIAVVDLFLALRFIFFAFKADNTGFVHIVYRVATVLDAPFRAIVKPTTTGGHPLLWTDVIAIAVYTVAAVILVMLIRSFSRRRVAAY